MNELRTNYKVEMVNITELSVKRRKQKFKT